MENLIAAPNILINLKIKSRCVPAMVFLSVFLSSCDESGRPLADVEAEAPMVVTGISGEDPSSETPVGVNSQNPVGAQPEEEPSEDQPSGQPVDDSAEIDLQNRGPALNGGLTGKIVTAYDEQPVEIDLATGDFRFLPLTSLQDLLRANDLPTNLGVRSYFTGTPSGGYIHSMQSCIFRSGGANDSCYAMYDSNLRRKSFLRTPNIHITGAIKLSKSGKLLAISEMETEDVDQYFSSDIKILNSSTNRYLINHRFEGLKVGEAPLAWGRNDELIFSSVSESNRVRIYVTDPDTHEIDRTILLPRSYDTEIKSLDMNPAGNRLLIQIEGRIRILDMRTLRLTTPIRAELAGLEAPRWSPDGKWISVINKNRTPAPVFDVSLQATVTPASVAMYVLPANASRTVVVDSEQTNVNAVLIQMEYPTRPGRLGTLFPGDRSDTIYYDWLP